MTSLSVKDYLFTGVQMVLFVAYIFEFKFFRVPDFLPNIVLQIFLGFGIGVVAMGLFQLRPSLSPFPRPRQSSLLIRNGVFKYIRHPIYSGIFLALLSYALLVQSSSKLIISIILLFWFYLKSKYEEELLLEKFPEYKAYKRQTGRFFPKLKFS